LGKLSPALKKEALFYDVGDPNAAEDDTNRAGNYNVKIKLNHDIPQLLPMLGKRIRVHYPGIQRICMNCFGNHQKSKCHSKKKTWADYIARFKLDNPEIDTSLIDCCTREPRKESTPQARSTSKLDQDLAWEKGDSDFNYTHEWLENIPDDTVNVVDNVNDIEPIGPACPAILPKLTSVQIPAKTSQVNTGEQPQKKEFVVPTNQIEHVEMVSGLVSAGISPIEAEQIISIREWKKLSETNTTSKTSNKPSKTAVTKANRNGN
jgi:hypothetical protein